MGKKLRWSLLIIFFYFSILMISSFFWILNITEPVAELPLAALASCAALSVYNKIKFNSKVVAGFVWNLVFLAAATGFCVLVSMLIFDNSYDGQTYHYETQEAIAHGWNSFRHQLTSGTTNIFFINHYAKGYESAAAFFQAFFKNPESGKALNILLVVACFLYVSYFLQRLKIYQHRFWSFCVALIIALNPVTVYQLFTFYVDGQIACLTTILIASLYLSMKKRSTLHLCIGAVIFCIMGDIKFTGLIYAMVIFGFFGLWMILKKIPVFRFVLAGFAAFGVTFCVIGFNPYVTNSVQQSNPFYPLVGKNKIDIITPVQPLSFAYKNGIEKFAEANFSESHNIHGHTVTPEPKFKIPFTFSVNEWLVFKGSECRIAGYGPLFGGIFLVSVMLLLAAIVIKKKTILKEDAFIISMLIFLTLIINPEMWMARYVPQLWLLPFCVIWLFRKSLYSGIFKKICSFLVVAIAVDVAGIAIINWGVSALISYKMHRELAWLKTLDEPVQIIPNDFIAAVERMKLYRIEINEVRRDTLPALAGVKEYKLQNSQAIILLAPGVPPFENTGILKLLNKKLE